MAALLPHVVALRETARPALSLVPYRREVLIATHGSGGPCQHKHCPPPACLSTRARWYVLGGGGGFGGRGMVLGVVIVVVMVVVMVVMVVVMVVMVHVVMV